MHVARSEIERLSRLERDVVEKGRHDDAGVTRVPLIEPKDQPLFGRPVPGALVLTAADEFGDHVTNVSLVGTPPRRIEDSFDNRFGPIDLERVEYPLTANSVQEIHRLANGTKSN